MPQHRNAGGPFVIFDPGLGVTGSLSIDGQINGTNEGLQIGTSTVLSGTMKIINSADDSKHCTLEVNSSGHLNIVGIDGKKVYIDDVGTDGNHEFSGNGDAYTQYHLGSTPRHKFYRGNGTVSSPAAVEDEDELGEISFHGTNGPGAGETGAKILAIATEDWSNSVSGTKITFHTQIYKTYYQKTCDSNVI